MRLFLLIFLLCFNTWALPLSSVRRPHEDYRAALHRTWGVKFSLESVYAAAKPLTEIETSSLPQWPDVRTLQKHFFMVRDQRFITEASPQPEFVRRISWLLPDDGCWARASLAVYLLEHAKVVLPHKVFTVGNLVANTPNHPSGKVYWSWHIAPVIAVKGTAYVLDPALDPKGPLTLSDWVALQGDGTQIQVALCDTQAFSPQDHCRGSTGISAKTAWEVQQQSYLSQEWYRQEELGRIPQRVLGDSPPW